MVELASLIAQEEFSDRPRCVCPVIGAFLRGWNDRAPYAERQRLGPVRGAHRGLAWQPPGDARAARHLPSVGGGRSGPMAGLAAF